MTLPVEIRQVSQRFNEVAALDDLTVTLAGGKIHGLLGRNGSGKSTLLSIIAAFRKPTAGEVLIDGEPVFENPRLVQQITLIREAGDTLDADEKVNAALCFARTSRPNWDHAYAEHLSNRFGLSMQKKIGQLSRGQRSALGIILGIASRSALTMFDESYLGLDAPNRYIFYEELLADYIRHPRTIIISTHLIEEVSSLFEEVIILDRGKLLMHEETDKLLSRGATITGAAEHVDRFVADYTLLSQRQLGPTKSSTIFGDLDEADRDRAAEIGLDVGPVALQDLFVHLTTSEGARP